MSRSTGRRAADRMPIGKPTAALASLQGVNIWCRVPLRGEAGPGVGQVHAAALTGRRRIGSPFCAPDLTPALRIEDPGSFVMLVLVSQCCPFGSPPGSGRLASRLQIIAAGKCMGPCDTSSHQVPAGTPGPGLPSDTVAARRPLSPLPARTRSCVDRLSCRQAVRQRRRRPGLQWHPRWGRGRPAAACGVGVR